MPESQGCTVAQKASGKLRVKHASSCVTEGICVHVHLLILSKRNKDNTKTNKNCYLKEEGGNENEA